MARAGHTVSSARARGKALGGTVMRLWPKFTRGNEPLLPRKANRKARESSLQESPILEIRAGGRRLRAVALGLAPRDAPTLVFLHEGLGCIALWRDFPMSLARRTDCNAMVYERHGYGGSEALDGPHPTDYLVREATETLPQILNAFGLEQAILVGHSDGGSIALLFAAAFPERTLGVITEAAHIFVEDASIAGVQAATAAYDSGDLRAKLARYHGDNTERMFRAWSEVWLTAAFREWHMVDRLPAIQAPVLAIQGADDAYGTPAQLEHIAAGVSGPVETLLIPDCSHTPHAEARDAVLAAMRRFIETLREV
jgi:pimeloyl-ACP methyl ester carboxylesterase